MTNAVVNLYLLTEFETDIYSHYATVQIISKLMSIIYMKIRVTDSIIHYIAAKSHHHQVDKAKNQTTRTTTIINHHQQWTTLWYTMVHGM